jgi:hypothetical protein
MPVLPRTGDGRGFTVMINTSDTGPEVPLPLTPVTLTNATPENEGFQVMVAEVPVPDMDPGDIVPLC